MRPFDPRLARDVKPVKGSIGFTAAFSFLGTLAFIGQSFAIALVVSSVFLEHASLASQTQTIAVGFGCWVMRTVATSTVDWKSRISGLKTVGIMREMALSKLSRMSPQQTGIPEGALASLLTRGINGLEIYVARYLPQLVLSAFVPLVLTGTILWLDPLSALIIAVTIPLIPAFMALIGWFTQKSVHRHWLEMNRLTATLADLMNGLPELKIFGRAQGLAKEIRALGEEQKDATMRVLRLSFLSAFALELLATISVALIAVAIGVRLVNGEIDLWRGLAALIMAPEVYAPLRLLGVHFHAAAEGLEAWKQLEPVVYMDVPVRGEVSLDEQVTVKWSALTVRVGERTLHVPAGVALPGQVTVIAGPSGCGKSTLLNILLGNIASYEGNVELSTSHQTCSPLDISEAALSQTFGYVSQNAWLGEGTVASILGENSAYVMSMLHLDLPLEREVTDRDQGISVGQRRRLAVARELLRKPHVLLLDEPAAALDATSEQALIASLQWFASQGHTVIAVAHRQLLIDTADSVVTFGEVAHA